MLFRAPGGVLDSKTFAVRVDDGTEQLPDELSFTAGSFKSVANTRYGFRETPYTADAADGAIAFTAVSANDQFGKITWKGKVSGDKIEGTAVWDQGWFHFDKKYAFKGSLATAPQAQ